MGVTVAVTRAACTVDTAPYTQDFTTADFGGLTPKAALFIGTYCTADGTPAAHRVWTLGATDGVKQWVYATTDEDAQDTTDSDSDQDLTNCVWFRNPGAETTDGLAAFSSFIVNGVRINWTDAPAAGYLLTVVLFAGTDLSVDVDYPTLGDTVDLVTDVTAPEFTPDLVFCMAPRQFVDTSWVSFGVVDWDGESVTQRSVCAVSRDNQATSVCGAYSRNDAGVIHGNQDGTLDWYGEFSDFDANGFTVTTRNAGANGQELCYLALEFNAAVSHKVLTHSTPTGIGSNSEIGVGFTPQFVLMLENFTEVVNTAYSDNRGGTIGIAAVTATAQYANSVQSEDAQATSDTQSISDDVAVRIEDDDGSAGLAAAFTSFDANGWTFNYTAVEAAAKLFFGLAIGAVAAGVTAPAFMHQYRMRRVV